MADFREWLVVDEVVRDVQGSIILEMALADADRMLVEFYTNAMEEDLGPVLEAQDDLEAELEEEPTEEEEQEIANQDPQTKNKDARRIQRLAWAVRWGAMLDRKELLSRIESIYTKEWKPAIRERSDKIRDEYEKMTSGPDAASDNDAKKDIAAKMGVPTIIVTRIINQTQNEWSVVKESNGYDDIPDEEDESFSFKERLREISKKVEPLLVKLGYLDSGELEFGEEYEKQKKVADAMGQASRETDNDPPENAITARLKRDPRYRATARRILQDVLYRKFGDFARSSWYKTSQNMPSMSGGVAGAKGRRGSTSIQSEEGFFSQGVLSIMRSLTERPPKGWKSITALSADLKKNPDKVIGSLMPRFSRKATKDEERARRKTAGQSVNSSDEVQFTSGGARQEDGSRSEIEGVAKTREVSSGIADAEAMKEFLDAFEKAMADLKNRDPLWAMLVCLTFNLNCAPNGSMPASSIEVIKQMVQHSGTKGQNIRQTPENFLLDLSRGDEATHQKETDELARKVQAGDFWDSLKDLKGGQGGARRTSPKSADGNKMKQMPTNPKEAEEWKKFMHTVQDARSKALRWLAYRIYEIKEIEGRRKSTGMVSPKVWDIGRFLRRQYPGASIVENRPAEGEQEIKISFPSPDSSKPSASFDILVKWENISIIQDGFDEDDEFQIPDLVKCPECDGDNTNCELCGGGGRVVDPSALRRLEWDIRQVLTRGQRKAKKKA